MTVREFIEKNDLQIITEGNLEKEIDGCYIGDLLSLAMSRVEEGQVWITIQGNVNIAAVAALTDPACILLVDGRSVDEATKIKAQEQGINILGTALSAYEAACRIFQQS